MDHEASGDAPSDPQLLGRQTDTRLTAAGALPVQQCGTRMSTGTVIWLVVGMT